MHGLPNKNTNSLNECSIALSLMILELIRKMQFIIVQNTHKKNKKAQAFVSGCYFNYN